MRWLPGSRTVSAGLVACLGAALTADAQCPTPTWSRGFGRSGINPEGDIQTLCTYDDGNGPVLYAGGTNALIFDGAWVVGGIARWDSDHWSNVGDGTGYFVDEVAQSGFPSVLDMTVWDPDGAGPLRPILVIVGDMHFRGPDRVPTNCIATWDGTQWGTLGDGIQWGNFDIWGTGWPVAAAVSVYNGELYVAGAVAPGAIGDETYFGIVKWDSTAWVPVGDAKFIGLPNSLAVYDNGTGPKLYVGGQFSQVFTFDPTLGYTPLPGTNALVTWDGTTWQAAAAIAGITYGVNSLRTLDIDGPGPQPASLFIGNGSGGQGNTIRLTGNTSTVLPDPIQDQPPAVFDDGTGPALYAYGSDQRLYRWTGSGSPVAVSSERVIRSAFNNPGITPRGGTVLDMRTIDLGQGPRLAITGCIGGTIDSLDHRVVSTYGLLTWDGARLAAPTLQANPVLQIASSDTQGTITSGVLFDEDGPGPLPRSLYVFGQFNYIGGREANSAARWDGLAWTPIGVGLIPDPTDEYGRPPIVNDPTILNTPSGQRLCIIARSPVDLHVLGIYMYDSGVWTPLGPAFDAADIESYDDGSGASLYATGAFTSIGATPISRIARWDGSAWVGVGASGLGLAYTPDPAQAAGTSLVVHDDGAGPKLYVFGTFDHADGTPAVNIARWNGSAWSAVGSLPNAATSTLSTPVSITGSPAAGLYIQRTLSGVRSVLVWNGVDWSTVSNPAGGDPTLLSNSGNEGTLYAVTGMPGWTTSLWKFDGVAWSLATTSNLWGAPASMTSVSDAAGTGIYLLGGDLLGVDMQPLTTGAAFSLRLADAISSLGIARLGCTTPPCPPDFNHSGSVTVQDIFDFLAAYFSGNPNADFNHSGSVTVQDIFDFLAAYFTGCP